jgi:hypothetical protein
MAVEAMPLNFAAATGAEALLMQAAVAQGV